LTGKQKFSGEGSSFSIGLDAIEFLNVPKDKKHKRLKSG
jgi:hypothetical protein